MVTISETFNSQAYDNIFLIPLWILLLLELSEARDKKKRKRLANQQRGFYRAEVNQSQQRYKRQIQERYPAPHF